MTSALDIMDAASDAVADPAAAWLWAAKAMVAAMGWPDTRSAMADGLLLGWEVARVAQDPANPRLFVLSDAETPGSRPCLLVPLAAQGHGLAGAVMVGGEGRETVDVLALDLTPGSGWFRRAEAAVAVVGGRDGPADVLALWQGAHRFIGALARAALASRRTGRTGREPIHPVAWPEGWLVLDPAALPWKGAALKGVEVIELVDAPVAGALGRVLMKMNRRIGGRGANAIALKSGLMDGVQA